MPVFAKPIAPVSDLDFDMRLGPMSCETLDERARALADFGFRRMYIIAPPLGYAMYDLLPFETSPAGRDQARCGIRSLLNLREPLTEAVAAAHRHGLEAYVVFKPYEGGGLRSVPENSPLQHTRSSLPGLGGPRVGVDPFLVRHPDKRVLRFADEAPRSGDCTPAVIEAAFCVDRVVQPSARSSRTYPGLSDAEVFGSAFRGVRLWESEDNGEYRPAGCSFTVVETVESRTVATTSRRPAAPSPLRCRVLRLENLQWSGTPPPYLAITFETGSAADVVTIPYTMVQVKNRAGEQLPFTVTDRLREAGDCMTPSGASTAMSPNGFEFDPCGFLFWEPGWRNVNCIALARGHIDYMKGTACEAYPEVRQHWLAEIDRFIRANADGVDIRLQNHSSAVSEYTLFGANEPLTEAYRQAYGDTPTRTSVDPLNMMRIRGSFFLEFLQAACARLHRHRRRLQVHMRACYENPVLSADQNQVGFWAMPKILPDWRAMVDVADEITIKDYLFGVYRADHAARIRQRAARAGKPVWMHCYQQQGADLNEEFCRAAQADSLVHGLLLYELAYHSGDHPSLKLGLCGCDDHGNLELGQETLERLRAFTTYG